MVGDMVSPCPLHSSKVPDVWSIFTSHLLPPTGLSHHSLHETKQSYHGFGLIYNAPCIGGLEGQQPNSPGRRPGCCMPCNDSASERQKHFPPDDNAFALSGRSGCYVPVTPGCYPGLVAQCPRQGRIRQLGWRIVTQQKKYRRH